MKSVLLADIGSTYTKVLVVDLEKPRIICRSFGLTTVAKGIGIGLEAALAGVYDQTGLILEHFSETLACSSAAGGLQMVAIGLVPELTAQAAKLASLGAGARVIDTYSYRLSRKDVKAIENLACDIILLAGGTDGGEQDTILHNAEKLAGSSLSAPIVVAGNKDAADQVEDILLEGNKEVIVTENVLPSVRKLNIDPARKAIREVFMERIVQGKGFAQVQDMFDTILMPTPAAVLEAAKLLSEGYRGNNGLGDLLIVDIGGATTDIHSVATGDPSGGNTIQRGLPEPKVKRTVEGDLGLRVSARSLLEAAGIELLKETANGTEDTIIRQIEHLAVQVDFVPTTKDDAALELAMAKAAAQIAVERHAGRLEKMLTPSGAMHIQIGKDLSQIKYVVGTGGIFAHSDCPRAILQAACMDPQKADILKPVNPAFMVDRHYILWGMGLLSSIDPQAAFTIMKDELQKVDQ